MLSWTMSTRVFLFFYRPALYFVTPYAIVLNRNMGFWTLFRGNIYASKCIKTWSCPLFIFIGAWYIGISMSTRPTSPIAKLYSVVMSGARNLNMLFPFESHHWTDSTLSNVSLHKKRGFPLRISSVNVTKFPADLVTFTEEILNGKLYFLYSVFDIFIA